MSARDLRRVLALHYRAHAGGRAETVDLRPCSDRIRHRPGQVGRIRDVHRQEVAFVTAPGVGALVALTYRSAAP
jgi:hypothetical protein